VIDWTSILLQVPLVAVFIWYSRDANKQFSETLAKRDELYEARNNVLVHAIEANTAATIQLCQSMSNHDTWTHEAVELMVANARAKTKPVKKTE
jgi:hypothetical protein